MRHFSIIHPIFNSTKVLALLLSAVCLLALYGCGSGASKGEEEAHIIPDSVMINLADYVEREIKVGSSISNIPLCSSIVNTEDGERYMMLDNGQIFIFDWGTGELIDSVSCGMVSGESGFTFVSHDSIFVYNQQEETLRLIDSKGFEKNKWQTPKAMSPDDCVWNVAALNATPILVHSSSVYLSGAIGGCLSMAKGIRIPATERLRLADGEFDNIAYYPNEYTEDNWGCYNMNNFSLACDAEGRLLYSFPINKHVLRYDPEKNTCDTIRFSSRYDTGIAPCTVSVEQLGKEFNEDVQYFISQHSYSSIMYDMYRNVYIRAAAHPRANKDIKSGYQKPMTFIVADTDGTVLSETSLSLYNDQWLCNNEHICKEGLAIAEKCDNENIIKFKIYRINEK